MVQRAIQHCCRLRNSRDPISSHVWISDDILKTQWIKFSLSTRACTTFHSRSFSGRGPSQREPNLTHDGVRQVNGQLIKNDKVLYQTRRHGSAAPGPLEARRRRALRKHMTGASNLGMFGSGLEFSGSPWHGDFGRVGQNLNRHGNSLYNALGMIWRWWLLDPDAPTRNEETAIPLVQENVRSDSFMDLCSSLDTVWLQEPKDIADLLRILLPSKKANLHELLQTACSWIRAEIALGSMTEDTIKTILWNTSQYSLGRSRRYSTKIQEQNVMICEAIANGLLMSTIRPLKTVGIDTTWMLLRSLVYPGCYDGRRVDFISKILHNLSEEQPEIAVQMSLATLETVSSRIEEVPGDYLGSLLSSLPVSIASTSLIAHTQNMARNCKTKKNFTNTRKLQAFLEELKRMPIFEELRSRPESEKQWLQIEHELLEIGIPVVAAYLKGSSEADVCAFILNHVVGNSKPSSARSQKQSKSGSTLDKLQMLPTDEPIYSDLLKIIEKHHPYKMKSVLRFMYPLFRINDRLSDCYNLNRYIFSRTSLLGRPSVEFFQNEIALWFKKHPLFAVLLLATDRRHGILHHPVVVKILAENSTDLENVPEEVISSLADALIATHSQTFETPSTRKSSLYKNSGQVLQLLLEPIAWGQCAEQEAFRIAKRIMSLLAQAPETLRHESSVAITNIVAVKALRARCRVPEWKLDWLAEVVTFLEGPEVWRETSGMIERWWRAIETEEDSNGRKWKHGVGWVQR